MCMRVLVRKLIIGFLLDMVHLLSFLVVLACFLEDMLDLGDGDHREKFQ